MFVRSEVPADQVHATLRKHMLVDGYPIVVDMENSKRSWVRDLVSGKEYLDFFSFFASNPIGFNHPSMLDQDCLDRLARVGVTKVSNADYYTTFMAEFVDTLSRTAGREELPPLLFRRRRRPRRRKRHEGRLRLERCVRTSLPDASPSATRCCTWSTPSTAAAATRSA